MNGLLVLLSDLITKFIERDFEEEQVRAAFTGGSFKVFLEDDYVELVKGSEYTLPRWLAQYLADRGYASLPGEGVDPVNVAIIAFNEGRSRSFMRFEKLAGYFYLAVKQEVSSLFKRYKSVDSVAKAKELSEKLDKLVSNVKQLHRLRLSKILSLLTVQQVTPEVISNLSEEEKHLYVVLRTLLEAFNEKVFEVERHG